jgi:Mg-chelatase subunit ChlI
MTLRLLINLSLSLLAWQTVCAQTADDFFYNGAQCYVTNNIAGARAEVDGGLKLYPDDIKLKKLDALLKQQSQQQSQNNQSQQNQSQQSQQQAQKNSQSNQQQNPQTQNQSNPQNQQSQKQQTAQAPSGQPKDESGEEAANTAGRMTPQEARQLLDAQTGDEQVLQLKPKEPPQNSIRPIKDW